MSTILEFWHKHYREVIFSIIILLAVWSNVSPIPLPIAVSDDDKRYFDTINSLNPGDHVYYYTNLGASSWGELAGGAISTLEHLAIKKAKIIICSGVTDGPPTVEKMLTIIKGGRAVLGVYGTDWVHLGYAPGDETGIAAMMAEPNGLVTTFGNKDYYGNTLMDMPIFNEPGAATDHRNIKLCINIGQSGNDHVVRQMKIPYGIPILGIDAGNMWPEAKAYIANGMVVSALKSLIGCAAHEYLIGIPGLATAAVVALSTNHLFLFAIFVIGNIEYWTTRGKKG